MHQQYGQAKPDLLRKRVQLAAQDRWPPGQEPYSSRNIGQIQIRYSPGIASLSFGRQTESRRPSRTDQIHR